MLSPEKIYVGCGLTNAPEEFKNSVEEMKDLLREDYEVFDFVGLVAGTAEDVYRWDMEHCVAECDLLVGVCDYPSIGLGWEMNEALHLGKQVLAVAHIDSLVTRMVPGAAVVKPNFDYRQYGNLAIEVPKMIDEKIIVMRNSLVVPETA